MGGDLSLNATNAILYDKTYQTVLYEKRAYEKVPNASTTKILTAIVAYENANVSDMVTISSKAASTGGSVIGLRTGNQVSLDGLIKGLLIHSGNDAAVAIAEYIGKDVDNFCLMLNEKARELGLHQTNFVTPHGLDSENHYSTAYDLAKMAEYLLNIEYLANIVNQKSANIQVDYQTRIVTTTNEMLSLYEGANGVKTGFTGKAGRCLITSCTRNGRTLIAVVLGCDTKSKRTEDSVKLLNYGFLEYELVDIFSIWVRKGVKNYYRIHVDASIIMPIHQSQKDKIGYEYCISRKFQAPISKGSQLGRIKVFVSGKKRKEIEVIFAKEIPQKSLSDYFLLFFN